ncbi:MAG: thiazole synthase, partial [Verrucomicrobia bacterium TMED56]
MEKASENFFLGGQEFQSRLFVGTGKFESGEILSSVIELSQTQLVTVALKRFNLSSEEKDSILPHITKPNVQILPNTSGVRDAKEAVFAAKMAREALETNFLKLEIHPDPKYLMPDPLETLYATEE